MTAWAVLLTVGLGTYLFRAVMFVVLGRHSLPAWTDRPLAFVGPAAIGALVGGLLLTSGGRFAPAGGVELAAAAAAFVVARRTGDVARGLLAGFVVLWVLSASIR